MGSHLHAYNCVSVRLDETNYATWVYLMFHHLRGHGLAKFIDGSHPCPSQFHVSGNNSFSVGKSEAYEQWEQHDSLVVSMITTTLSVDALTLVIGCETSLKVWTTLKQHYAPNSEFHIGQLRSAMHKIRKGSDTIDRYLLRFKSVRDDLAVAGLTRSDKDVMHYILVGLPVEYGPTRQLIWSKREINMDEMRCLLLSGELEIKLKQYSSPLSSLADLYVAHNYTCRRNSYLHGDIPHVGSPLQAASMIAHGDTGMMMKLKMAQQQPQQQQQPYQQQQQQLQQQQQQLQQSQNMPQFSNAMSSVSNFATQSQSAPPQAIPSQSQQQSFAQPVGNATSVTKSASVESNSRGKARSFSSMSSEYYGSTAAYESDVIDALKFNPQDNRSMQVHTPQANLHSPLGNGNSIQGDQGNARMERDIKCEISSTSASESSSIKNEARNVYPSPLSCFAKLQALSATMSSNLKSHSKITRSISNASQSQSSNPMICRQACATPIMKQSLPLIPPG